MASGPFPRVTVCSLQTGNSPPEGGDGSHEAVVAGSAFRCVSALRILKTSV